MEEDQVHDFEIEIGPTGYRSSVKVNGKPVKVYRMVITVEPSEPTRIELDCYGPRYEKVRVSGRMVVDEEAWTASPLDRGAIQDVTHVGAPNRLFRRGGDA